MTSVCPTHGIPRPALHVATAANRRERSGVLFFLRKDEERLPSTAVCSTRTFLLLCCCYARGFLVSIATYRIYFPLGDSKVHGDPLDAVQHQQLLSLLTRSCVRMSACLLTSLCVPLVVCLPIQRCPSHTLYLLPRGLESNLLFYRSTAVFAWCQYGCNSHGRKTRYTTQPSARCN